MQKPLLRASYEVAYLCVQVKAAHSAKKTNKAIRNVNCRTDLGNRDSQEDEGHTSVQ